MGAVGQMVAGEYRVVVRRPDLRFRSAAPRAPSGESRRAFGIASSAHFDRQGVPLRASAPGQEGSVRPPRHAPGQAKPPRCQMCRTGAGLNGAPMQSGRRVPSRAARAADHRPQAEEADQHHRPSRRLWHAFNRERLRREAQKFKEIFVVIVLVDRLI